MTEKRDVLTKLNESINWKPKSTGEGRFGNWLSNANDWNLSRSRFWGIPLPIWRTEDSKETIMIGSVEELKNEITKSISLGFMKTDPFDSFEINNMEDSNYDKIDLHKNIVDDIVLSSKGGQKMYREPDLIDVWFDSGSMPYAQWHYPFENREMIDQNIAFPALAAMVINFVWVGVADAINTASISFDIIACSGELACLHFDDLATKPENFEFTSYTYFKFAFG